MLQRLGLVVAWVMLLPPRPLVAEEGAAAFDLSATALPAGFAGEDVATVYRSYLVQPKGEFETTEQFEARKAAVEPALHALVVPGPSVSYDADQGRFLVKVRTIQACDRAGCGPLLTLRDDFELVRTYEASNAFGATVKVSEIRKDIWGALLPKSGSLAIELGLAMEPSRAEQMKERLGMIALVRTGPESGVVPLLANDEDSGFEHEEATISSPRDVTTHYHLFRATPVGYWLFDRESGNVLGKFTPAGHEILADGTIRLKPAEDTSDVIGRVYRGMTTAEAAEATKPLQPKVVKRRNREEWTFGSSLVLVFSDGRLSEMRTGRERLTLREGPRPPG
jgi:hypothetical protein